MAAEHKAARYPPIEQVPVRFLDEQDFKDYIPVHVVWEITLACDLKCLHCGSRAGHRRTAELSTAECLEVVESLARLEHARSR